MGTNIVKVARLLEKKNIKYTARDDGKLTVSFSTKDYSDFLDKNKVVIEISLCESGRYIKICAPEAYKIPHDHEQITLFLLACCQIQWVSKLVHYEYNAGSGEVRPCIEFPLENNKITAKQLSRCVRGLAHLIDKHDFMLRRLLYGESVEFNLKEETIRAKVEQILQNLGVDMMASIEQTDPPS